MELIEVLRSVLETPRKLDAYRPQLVSMITTLDSLYEELTPEDDEEHDQLDKAFNAENARQDNFSDIAELPGREAKKQNKAVEDPGRGEKESNAVESEGKEVGKAREGLPNIGKHDKQAYQMSLLHNITQEMIAEKLNREYGATYTQGQVSRMISRMKEHVEASGLSEFMPASSGPIQILDPTVIEMGEKKSQLTSRQRDMRDPDSD